MAAVVPSVHSVRFKKDLRESFSDMVEVQPFLVFPILTQKEGEVGGVEAASLLSFRRYS